MWPFSSSSPKQDEAEPASACPVDHTTRQKWLEQQQQQQPGGPSSSSRPPPSHPAPSSAYARYLSEEREISTIPRHFAQASANQSSASGSSSSSSGATAASSSTSQDPSSNPNWVYPSQAQFHAALQRKGRSTHQASDMGVVVPIHNAVNEKAWKEILAWERGSEEGKESWQRCGGPKLVSFKGKPTERTWKAWWRILVGYQAPFDRHDWLIDRCGHRMRYIIDFYAGKAASSNSESANPFYVGPSGQPQMSFYLDVRPAPDTMEGIGMRLRRWGRELLGTEKAEATEGTQSLSAK